MELKQNVVIGAEGMLRCFNKKPFINFVTTDIKITTNNKQQLTTVND